MMMSSILRDSISRKGVRPQVPQVPRPKLKVLLDFFHLRPPVSRINLLTIKTDAKHYWSLMINTLIGKVVSIILLCFQLINAFE